MIAEVYPLKRMPRRFTFFDYKVQKEQGVSVGDMVEVSFKKKSVLAVVRGMKKTSRFKRLQPVLRVVEKNLLKKDDIKRLEQISFALVQSPCTVAYTALTGMNDRDVNTNVIQENSGSFSLNKQEVAHVKDALDVFEKNKKSCVRLNAEESYALLYAIRERTEAQLLIICPLERSAHHIASSLPFAKAGVLTGTTPAVQRESIIKFWRRGKIKTLVGTRQSALIPAKKISAVAVYNASSGDFRKLDRNPRIDARHAAELLADQHNAKYTLCSTAPPLFAVQRNFPLLWNKMPKTRSVDLKAREERTNALFISETLRASMSASLQNNKNVLLSFNRKGFAKRLQCKACGHIPICGTCESVPSVRKKDLLCSVCKTEMWIPKNCPACGEPNLRKRGIGNKRILSEVKKLFPGIQVGIVEKGSSNDRAPITIATEYFFTSVWHPFYKKTFGTVAELSADLHMGGTDFRSAENAFYKLTRLRAIAAGQRADCIVQTWLPDVVKPMLNEQEFYSNELRMRRRYGLPPSTAIMEVTCKKSGESFIRHLDPKTSDDTYKHLQKRPDSCIMTLDAPTYTHVTKNRPTSPKR